MRTIVAHDAMRHNVAAAVENIMRGLRPQGVMKNMAATAIKLLIAPAPIVANSASDSLKFAFMNIEFE